MPGPLDEAIGKVRFGRSKPAQDLTHRLLVFNVQFRGIEEPFNAKDKLGFVHAISAAQNPYQLDQGD